MEIKASATDKHSGILLDSHVHFYRCFDETEFLQGAVRNFTDNIVSQDLHPESVGVLMLTESSGYNWFQEKINTIDDRANQLPDGLSLHATGEAESFIVRNDKSSVVIVAGRQIVTSEGLEVLALGTRAAIADGLSVYETLDELWNAEAVAVMPWAVGKWFGRRGKIVNDMIRNIKHDAFLLGDNSGRPYLWPTPVEFSIARDHGISTLPGSDPLPLRREVSKAGSFGAIFDVRADLRQPAAWIKKLLRGKDIEFRAYGRLETLNRFIRNQLALRL